MWMPKWLRSIAAEPARNDHAVSDDTRKHQERMHQIARELRHELLPASNSPVYDDVIASARARDGLAAEVETWLATQSGGAR